MCSWMLSALNFVNVGLLAWYLFLFLPLRLSFLASVGAHCCPPQATPEDSLQLGGQFCTWLWLSAPASLPRACLLAVHTADHRDVPGS